MALAYAAVRAAIVEHRRDGVVLRAVQSRRASELAKQLRVVERALDPLEVAKCVAQDHAAVAAGRGP